MFRWIPYAFVRILLFFCTGVLLAINFPNILPATTSIGLLLCLISLYVIVSGLRPRKQLVTGVTAMMALACAGFVNVQVKDAAAKKDNFFHAEQKIECYTAVVIQPVQEAGSRWKMLASIRDVRTTGGWLKRDGKVLLYIPKEQGFEPLHYGDVLLITGSPQEIPPPANPGEFDYKQFLAYKRIHHQHFVANGHAQWLSNQPPDKLFHYAISARLWADSLLKKYIPGEREKSLASALVLGVTDGLDNELLNAYAATGAMHVLSVSGLHVGIVYWLLLLLFKPFEGIRAGKWILLGVSLIVLWSYAFITGLSPSVLRAVTMFSFAAIARPWNHKTNIYNILAASGFCLLVYDPLMIMSVGFQLSYLAVLGIVAIQPGLYRLWEPSHRLLDEIWKIVAVSVAAQIATVSIGLFYFHQFPNYFLLTNLFVIPGSFVVLIMGILMLAISFIAPLLEIIGWLLYWVIKLLNTIVFGIESIPFSLTDNIYINSLQCWTGIILILVALVWIESKRKVWLITASALCVVFSTSGWIHHTVTMQASRITVYSVRGSSAVDLICEGKTHFIGDSAVIRDRDKTKFHLLPNRLFYGATRVVPLRTCRTMHGCTLLAWKGITILRVHDPGFTVPLRFNVDVIVLSHNAVRKLAVLSGRITAKHYIVDSSNATTVSSSLLSQAEEMDLNVHAVLQQGAFELRL